MEKKNKKVKATKIKYNTQEQADIKKFLIVIAVVLVFVGGVWFITTKVVDTGETKKDKTEETVEAKVNYDVAVVGNMLNRPYDEYYVVVYDTKGDYLSDMTSMVSSYLALDKHLHVYTVELDNKLNADYYDPENVNVNAKSVSEFKFGDITLVKVKNHTVTKYIVDYSKMKKELGVK